MSDAPMGFQAGWNAPFPEEIADFPNHLPPIHLYQEALSSKQEEGDGTETPEVEKPDNSEEPAPDDVPWGSLLQPPPTAESTQPEEQPPTTRKRSHSELEWPTSYPPLPVQASKKIRDTLASTTIIATSNEPTPSQTVRTALVQVPPGRSADATQISKSIVPVHRASGSRVSRILEGSEGG